MTGLTAVSLFGGIEGFGLALERCGVNVVASVEIDPDCRGVTARHFPETHLFDDVRTVTGNDLIAAGFVPGRGILCAGWPCQGNSVAGRRGGMADPRSGLWRHVVRLLAETRPAWFIGENVPGLLSVNGGADIAVVRDDLAQLGYWWAERTLDSQYFGVPQRRQRVFFVGCPGDGTAPVEVLLEPEGGDGHPAARGEARPGTAAGAPGGAGSARTVGTLGTTSPGGGWRVGADEAAAGQLIAASLQGGGRRGHRIDAEGAAGGHLIPFDTVQITHRENRSNPQPGDPSPTLNGNGATCTSPLPFRVGEHEAAYALTSRASRASRASREETYIITPDTSAAITAHHGKGPDSDATNGLIVTPLDLRNAARDSEAGETAGTGIGEAGDPSFGLSATHRAIPGVAVTPVALRGRADGSNIEVGKAGDPAFTLRTPGGGSSHPMIAATLSSGSHGKGVSAPGRHDEDQFNLVSHALTSEGADASEDGTGRGTPLVPYARPVPSSLAVAGDFSTGEDIAQTVRSAHGQPGCVAAGLAVRRLTPKECERLQAFPDITRALRIEVRRCSDRPRNPALADYQSPRSQKPASNVGAPESWNPAQPADSHSRCFRPDLGLPVAASVHIDCEASAAEVRSPDGRRWSVNGAALKDPSPLAVLLDVSARLHALTPHGQARATSTGRAESPPSLVPSTHQPSGAICVPVCGLEIDGSADGAHECGLTEMSRSTFTTSRAGRTTQTSGSTWTTLCSSVLAAIGSFIPLPTPATTSYAVELTATAGWTRWKLVNGVLIEQSDSARYRQVGNAVTVSVIEWIARRIVALEASREADQAGAA